MIDSSTAAHMVAQIRAKQRSIKSAHDYLVDQVNTHAEEQIESSGEISFSAIQESISRSKAILESKNSEISGDKQLVTGFPINNSRSGVQLRVVEEWASHSQDNLISDISKGKLHRGLNNNIADDLPQLGADSDAQFWGNENSSVSTMMLYLTAHHLGADVDVNIKYLAGAATLYPFVDTRHSIKIDPHPFLFNKSMILFGDYQLGGHRYFSRQEHNIGQRVFASEDCSSAVGKTLGLTEAQIIGIWTGALRDDHQQYGLTPVTTSKDDQQINMDLIETGDVFVRGGHTSIIYRKDNSGNIFTMDFNRDLNAETGRGMLGGGTYQRNLFDAQSRSTDMYVFRHTDAKLKESVSLTELIARIDSEFAEKYQDGVKNDKGDCSMFL